MRFLLCSLFLLHITCLFANASYVYEWSPDLSIVRTLDNVQVDPEDTLASSRGSGSITFRNDNVMEMKGSRPRFYVRRNTADWLNVEMTAYVTLTERLEFGRSYAGFTMVARTDHQGTLAGH